MPQEEAVGGEKERDLEEGEIQGPKMLNQPLKEDIQQILKKSRLGRNDFVGIFDVLPLLKLACQEKPSFPVENSQIEEYWIKSTRHLATEYNQTFGASIATPYLHVFVYHLGFFFQKYGSLGHGNSSIQILSDTNKKK